MFTSDLTRRQRAWPGAACVALSPRRRGLTRRLCDRGAAQPQRAAAGRAVGGRRVNPSPASGRPLPRCKTTSSPGGRRASSPRRCAWSRATCRSSARVSPRVPEHLIARGPPLGRPRVVLAPAAAPAPRTARDHTNNARRERALRTTAAPAPRGTTQTTP